MKKVTNLLFATILIMTAVSCEVNIDSDDDCLECSYKFHGNTRTERLCDAYGTIVEMELMRDRMQVEADSLNVTLNCKRD